MFRKLFSLLTIILMTTSPAAAQENEVAAAAALDSVIRIFSHYDIVDNFVDEVFKKHKKSASMATRIAKSYYSFVENPETKQRTYYRRDLPRAFSYIDKALAINPKYSKAYIVASDIFFNEAKLDTAQMWLDKGIAVNPTDSALYIESAKLLAFTDPDAAVKKLMVLKQRDSTFQVDLQLGRLYYNLYDKHGKLPMVEMATAYGKVFDSNDRSKLTLYDLSYFCMGLQFAGDLGNDRFSKLYEVTAYGIEQYPKDFGLYHFHLLGCLNTQNYDEGIETMGKMKALPDSVKKLKDDDYLWYGSCLAGAKRYDDAIAQYEYVLAMNNAGEDRKTRAENLIVSTLRSQVKELSAMGEYEQAVALIEPYVLRSRENGKQNDQLANSLVRTYFEWSDELNGQEKLDIIAKGIKVSEEAVRYSELNAPMFLYYCCRYSWSDLDPEFKKSLALPYAEQIISLLESKSDLSENERTFLVFSYRYMAAYEYLNRYAVQKIKNAKKTALAYAEKILDIDQTNEWALNFLAQVH